MQVSWAQYFDQDDIRTTTYYVEKTIDENMGIFHEYLIKNLLEKQSENTTVDELIKEFGT